MKIKGQVFLLFCASAMLLFCGCHSNPATVENQSTNQPSATLHISQLVPKGCWINSGYKQTLLRTKSLYIAQRCFWDTINGHIAGHIDQIKFKDDSIYATYALHEGSSYLAVTMIDSFNFIATDSNDGDTVLKGKFSNDYKELNIMPTYQGEPNSHLSFSDVDILDFINNMFISKYLGFDATGKFIDTVQIQSGDKVTGLDNYKYYEFYFDFEGPGMNLDQVELEEKGKTYQNPTRFGWKIDEDTLFLYHLICTEKMDSTAPDSPENCATYKNGDVFVKLVKMK